MATGDQNDVESRIESALPPWFGDISKAPIILALITGFAASLATFYSLFAYTKLQTRIKTATDGFLDMIAGDWFGLGLQRRSGQSDVSYRALIISWIFRERATRYGLIKALEDVTGRTPGVLEPWRALDLGAYNTAWGYNDAGAYFNPSMPKNEVMVIAYRPLVGSQQYGVQDADIYSAIEAVRPAGVVVWVQIQN